MSLKDDVMEILDAEEMTDSHLDRFSGQDPRLDNYSVISRIYDKDGLPVIYAGGRTYGFCRFTMEKTGNVIEIKFHQV